MAERISIITIECLLYLLIKIGVSKPILVKKYTKIGNWNISPLAKLIVATVDANDVKLILFMTKSLTVYDPKKLTDKGAIMK